MFVVYFLAVNFDWSISLIRKSFAASRHISGKLGVKLAIGTNGITNGTIGRTLNDIGVPLVSLVEP